MSELKTNPDPRYTIRWSHALQAFILERGPDDIIRYRESELPRLAQYLRTIAVHRRDASAELDAKIPKLLFEFWKEEAHNYPPKGKPSQKDLDDLEL